ncbi:MAG: HlyD family secretion protein [Acidobacteria bacterium]|nr:MAG: HlyD family secretion protein [Acidobacteriota bacterium]
MTGRVRRVGRVGRVGLVLALAAGACARSEQPDAYGNVEATEVVVSSEVGGQLTTFTVEEGQTLAAGDTAGTVDPTQLTLQRQQAMAQRETAASRVNEVDQQVAALTAQRDALQAQHDAAVAQRSALQAQLEIARRNHERMQRLYAQQAATAQQLDQAERDDRVLQEQIKAQDAQIAAQGRQVAAQAAQVAAAQQQQRTAQTQIAAADAQVAQVDDRIKRAAITNPSAGTVLVTYAKPGEIVQPGQPLYKIADVGTVDVRAYVTEPQLAAVKVGKQARVSVDAGNDNHQTLNGTVSWVSSQAEFTPTPIQTREERADLVYAVKIRVPNQNGMLKIGMPVDVDFQ